MKFERDTRYYDIALERVGDMWIAARRWGSKVRNQHNHEAKLYSSEDKAMQLIDYWVKRRRQHKYEVVR